MPVAKLTRRERRTIAAGASVVVIAMVIAFVAVPYARRWSAREELIATGADRIARLQALIDNESRLRQTVQQREMATGGARLVSGRTAALAGSALQDALQDYATRSRLTVTRLDLAGTPDSSQTGLPGIPISLSAIGDVYGISDFLSLVTQGSLVLEVRQLTIVSNSSLRGGLLQLTLALSAPAIIQ
ncbi:MAG TPA: type II secretion system protein GspM [Gemmatimonadaceae bacterium]|nr:type II secretion system protein GspM [Gemmatimonadaceae bacterium]